MLGLAATVLCCRIELASYTCPCSILITRTCAPKFTQISHACTHAHTCVTVLKYTCVRACVCACACACACPVSQGDLRALEETATPLNVNGHATDGRRSTPLHLAAGFNQPEVLRILLTCGADVHARDKGGLVGLLCACLDLPPSHLEAKLSVLPRVYLRCGTHARCHSGRSRPPSASRFTTGPQLYRPHCHNGHDSHPNAREAHARQAHSPGTHARVHAYRIHT